MKNESEVREMLERIVHRYSQMEKKKRDYGVGEDFTQAEIHTVAYIGENEGASQDELARSKGITKGAASQMVTRLAEKGLAERRVSEDSNAKCALYLTEKGKRAFQGHMRFHRDIDVSFRKVFKDISPEEYDTFVKILERCDEALKSV